MSRILNLLKYFAECIEIESLEKFSFPSFTKDQSFLNLSIQKEWSASDQLSLIISPPPDFRKKLALGGAVSSLYYGWPIFARTAITKSGNPYAWIEPVFLLRVEFEQNNSNFNINLLKEWPRINDAILKRYTENLEEGMQVLDLLGISESEFLHENGLIEFWNRFNNLYPNVQVIENIDPEKMEFSDYDDIMNDGFYNRAILISAEAPRYHRGLLRELRKLQSFDIEKIESTSLNILFHGHASLAQEFEKPAFIQVSQLNRSQRDATFKTFTNPLTVITGPPGTGKSQVVLNLLANAFEQNKTALFTSKNNKAVDVVCKKLLELIDFPINLRLGSKTSDRDYTTEFLDLLDKVLSGGDKDAIIASYKRSKIQFEKIREEYFGQLDILENVVTLRNKIDELDQSIEFYESRIDKSLLSHAQNVVHTETNLIELAKEEVNKIRSNQLPFHYKFFCLFSKSYAFKKLHKLCVATNEIIGNLLDLPVNPTPVVDTYSAFLEQASYTYGFIKIFSEITELRNDLSEIDINDLSHEVEKIEREFVVVCTRYIEALGRYRIINLSSEERRSPTNYYAVVRQLAGDYPGNKAYAQLKEQQEKLFRVISKILPVWSVTNLSASGHFPLADNIFDIVVIDEASQSDIPSAIPLLYRAKKVVIIGDPQQLRHISSIRRPLDNRLMQKHKILGDDNLRFCYSVQSLYHCARGAVSETDVTLLNEHYRSHFSIIEFSNREWYDGHLDIRTNYDNLIFPPDERDHIEWINVIGRTIKPHGTSGLNEIEANRVLELLEILFKLYKDQKSSVGIVTPFSAQKKYLTERLSEKYDDEIIKNHFLLANTAHQFQGDERDIVIFSPVISKDASSTTIGFLRYTSNLFNVAITRARSLLWVVGDREACINAGISYLKNFVEYIQHRRYKNIDLPYDGFQSPWEKKFFEVLKSEGFNPVSQNPVGPYFIDIAIQKDGLKLAIEIDGDRWHTTLTGERLERDIVRDRNIRRMGWDVIRFWVHDLKYDLNNCVQAIQAKFDLEIGE